MGVDEDRLSARGYSNSRPLAWRFGDRAGAVNRRVELYVTAHGLTVPARRPRSEYASVQLRLVETVCRARSMESVLESHVTLRESSELSKKSNSDLTTTELRVDSRNANRYL